MAERAKAARAADPEKARIYGRDYSRGLTTEKRREYRIKTTYGLTADEVVRMREEQSNLCLICLVEMRDGKGGDCIAIDHDHGTGEVRGLLCQKCNAMLGLANDDPDRLIAAAAYLIQWATKKENR